MYRNTWPLLALATYRNLLARVSAERNRGGQRPTLWRAGPGGRVRRGLIIGAAVLGVGVVAAIWIGSRGRERLLYQGKPVSAWAAQLTPPGAQPREEAAAALKAMGPRAVPELIRCCRLRTLSSGSWPGPFLE